MNDDDPVPVRAVLGAARQHLEKAGERFEQEQERRGRRAPIPPDEMARMMHEGQRELREQVWRVMIPSRFIHARMDDFEGGAAQALTQWATEPYRPNLVVLGPVGVGKTHAAVAACRPDFEAGLEVAFHPVVEVLDDLRPGGRPGAWDDLVAVDRLILDDLGRQRDTDWTDERLYALINRRWLEERPTIATSNLPATRKVVPQDFNGTTLEEALGEATFSRLVGNGAVVLQLTGDDRRRKRRAS